MLCVSRLCINAFGLCIFRTSSFSFGLDKVVFFSFPYLSVLLPSEAVCSHSVCVLHDFGCVVEVYWVLIGRRSSDASRRPSRSPPLMRATYHLIVIDDFYDLFIHPTLALPHIPCTYLPLLSLSFIVCCFVIPFPFTALTQSLYPWLRRSEILSWHFISTSSEKTIRKTKRGNIANSRSGESAAVKNDELLLSNFRRGKTISRTNLRKKIHK